jgi:uncharacterized membrane protein
MGMSQPATGYTRAVVLMLDRSILWLTRHWCACVNAFAGLYMGLPLLAPILLAWHLTAPASWIYFVYQYFCHQLPERSFFIFGHQMAYCERDTAIYTGAFVLGLLYAKTRRRWTALPWWGFALFLLPVFVDGSVQLVSTYQSTWSLRILTGSIGVLGTVWFLYPRFDTAMERVGQAAEMQLQRATLREQALASLPKRSGNRVL